MGRQSTQNGIHRLWHVASSMRLGMVLMFLMAGSLTLGTTLPVNLPQDNVWGQISQYLGLNQVYNTWWFKIIAVLLALNVLACFANRIRAVVNVFVAPRMKVSALDRLKCYESVTSRERPDDLAGEIIRILLANRFRVLQSADEDQVHLYADKNRLAVLGPVLAHLGLLILMFGVAWLNMFGLEGTVTGIAGTTFKLSSMTFVKGNLDTDYTVKIDKDIQQTLSAQGTRNIRGTISVVDSGSVLKTGEIGINEPFRFDGLSFHLIGYEDGVVVSLVRGGKSEQYILKPNNNKTKFPFPIIENEEIYIVFQVDPDFSPSRPTATYSILQHPSNPVVLSQGHLGQGETGQFRDVNFGLEGYLGTMVLRVTKSPGLWLILSGGLVLALGMCLSLFLRYRKIWISIFPEGEFTLAQMGGFSSKQQVRFTTEFNDLAEEIKAYPGG